MMKTPTSIKLVTAGLCLWATIAVVSCIDADSSEVDRTIKIGAAMWSTGETEGTREDYRAALEAQRACVAEELSTVDPKVLEDTLVYYDKMRKCLEEKASVEAPMEMFLCFEILNEEPEKVTPAVLRSIDKCGPKKTRKVPEPIE